MLILHISDIHFRTPNCKNEATDPDRPYRTAMINSVADYTARLGPVDAILVTGDIAFKADKEEYAIALRWLADLAYAAQCDLSCIHVVPGNHDVQRGVIAKEQSIKNVHLAMRSATPGRRECALREQISSATTAQALLQPLTEYNEFAKRFDCQVYLPEDLYWRHDLELRSGVILRLHGLTSTLLSGAVRPDANGKDTQDDDRMGLYLSPMQTVLDPVENVVNLVMAHHPPDWFMDHDEIEDAMNGRATLHLFGHKHKQRIMREKWYARFHAGAVNPDREENGWVPCYNLINLEVVGSGAERILNIKAFLLEWQTNPDQFRPKRDGDTELFHHSIPIPCRNAVKKTMLPSSAVATQPASLPAEIKVEVAMSEKRSRNLMMRFWDLSSSTQIRIMLELGLIEEKEKMLPEQERYRRAFRRACERGLIEKLDQEVTKCLAK
jgi:calcineurin-like phosphoesterase family protein